MAHGLNKVPSCLEDALSEGRTLGCVRGVGIATASPLPRVTARRFVASSLCPICHDFRTRSRDILRAHVAALHVGTHCSPARCLHCLPMLTRARRVRHGPMQEGTAL